MRPAPARFAVDLDHLDATVRSLESCAATYDDLLDEVRRRVESLHLTWTGAAAAAHDEAQADWHAGFARMREALDDMRRAAAIAHHNYAGAIEANLSTWHSV